MAMGQSATTTLAERASRFYARGEWASSRAAYMTLARDHTDVAEYWVRSIVSSLMEGNNGKACEETLAGIERKVPVDTIFDGVLDATISLGKNSTFEHYLIDMKETAPWISRVADRCLLRYYVFRDDGAKIVSTAASLLKGTPDNMLFLPSLAYGQLLCGDLTGMAATNRRILELDPKNKDALLYLANYHYYLWEQGAGGEKTAALDYTKRAYQLWKTPKIKQMLEELTK